MGKVYPISDELLKVMRRELRKHGVTLVRNKKTVSYRKKLTSTLFQYMTQMDCSFE